MGGGSGTGVVEMERDSLRVQLARAQEARRDAEHAAARMAVEVVELRARVAELEDLVEGLEEDLRELEGEVDALDSEADLDDNGEGAAA